MREDNDESTRTHTYTYTHAYTDIYIRWQTFLITAKDETLTFGSQSVGDKAIRGWWRL